MLRHSERDGYCGGLRWTLGIASLVDNSTIRTVEAWTPDEYIDAFACIAAGTYDYCYRITDNTMTDIIISPEEFHYKELPVGLTHSVEIYAKGDLIEMEKTETYEEIRRLYPEPVDSGHYTIPYYWVLRKSIREMPQDILIEISPTPDTYYIIQMDVSRYSKTLTADADTSWWSVNHPEMLLQAILMKIDIFLRNMRSANEQRTMLIDDLLMLDHDEVEADISDEEMVIEG